MFPCRLLAVALVVVATGGGLGCTSDGRYVVRGVVSGRIGGVTEPLCGARVEIAARENRKAFPGSALTGKDGRYEAFYSFYGTAVLFWGTGDGDPFVAFSAPGYRTCVVQLRTDKTEAGVTRQECVSPSGYCFGLDVVLAPEGSARGLTEEECAP
jgi:hypothetical protein